MRTFGNDAPKFMEFKLDGSKKVYKLPLSASVRPDMNLQLFDAMQTEDAQEREYKTQHFILDMLTAYLGADFVESIDFATMMEIWQAWLDESRAANQDAGE